MSGLAELASAHYLTLVSEKHGKEGVDTAKKLLASIRQTIYKYLEPSVLPGTLTVFSAVPGRSVDLNEEGSVLIREPSGLSQLVGEKTLIQVLDSGSLRVWSNKSADYQVLSQAAVVYHFENDSDVIFAGGESRSVTRVLPNYSSVLSVPTFTELESALEHYKSRMIRCSSCPVFSEAWFDQNRIFFTAGPEHKIRNSLTHFLKCALRGNVDVEVRPEQNMDESHPVDIKVTWFLGKIAIIEIKWLGKSRKTDGQLGTEYFESRALAGAQQLADYLDQNRVQAPTQTARGYLVIVDARRRATSENTTTISRVDGMHYQHAEISYNPEFHGTRDDFAPPFRMFAEPICT